MISFYKYNQGTGFPLRLRIAYTQPQFPDDFSGGLLTTTVGIDICFRPKTPPPHFLFKKKFEALSN
ncbi:hypothetical protein FACS1894201_08400 [Bacteroidia bacterium]|nr:hypothetical protein FACS1894201_08400 [Bacteroidia bacterium]